MTTKFKVGDQFIPRKPIEGDSDYILWTSFMDDYDGKALTVERITETGNIQSNKRFIFHPDWCEKVENSDHIPDVAQTSGVIEGFLNELLTFIDKKTDWRINNDTTNNQVITEFLYRNKELTAQFIDNTGKISARSEIFSQSLLLPLGNDEILKGIQTSLMQQLPKEWLKNEHLNSNYMGGFLNAVRWMESNARKLTDKQI